LHDIFVDRSVRRRIPYVGDDFPAVDSEKINYQFVSTEKGAELLIEHELTGEV
jgi:hypothetical protein